jgi:serine/threonine protein kinase
MGAAVNACPPARTLERLLAEQLAGSERDSVETHVEGCPSCQDQLEILVARTSPDARPPARPADSAHAPGDGFLSRLRDLAAPGAGGGHAQPAPAGPGGAGLPVPGRLGPYEVLGLLGKGGMGAVYKARHTELGKLVAIKVLPVERVDEANIARFKKEVRALGKLDHPNIVVAFDAGESGGVHFLVTELVDGTDLARVVERRGRLSVADACEVVRQAAVGLQHAFERGLVHRDVKPNNLMLARDGRVRLLDLGLARVAGEATVDALTAQGMVVGSADYLAPEQWENPHAADTRADIYGLGCTLFHLLAGRPPFGQSHRTLPSKMQAHLDVPPPPVGQFCPDVPDGLVAVLGRMLAKAPSDRYAAPAEVAAALRPFTADADLRRLLAEATPGGAAADAATPVPAAWETDPDRPGRPRSAPSRTRRRALPVVLAGLGLLAAVVLIARPWVPGVADTRPLEVKDVRVTHRYREDGKTFEADLWTSSVAVRLQDDVQILVGLTRPAYCYLIALNPQGSHDGKEQLCQPDDKDGKAVATGRPERQTEVRYPRGTRGFEVDAVGLQAFVLAASTKPLPPYKEWRANAGAIPWPGGKDGGKWRWHFDGRAFTRYPRERGRVVPRDEAPDLPESLRKLRDFFTNRSEFDLIQIVAFPVKDDRK